MKRSHLAAFAAIGMLSVMPACASSDATMSGKRFSGETLSMIGPGDSADAITGLLGEPTGKSQEADGSVLWKWRYQQSTTSNGALLFVVVSSEDDESSGTMYVQLREGKVVKHWRE